MPASACEARCFAVGGGSQRGSGAEPPAGSRAQFDKRSSGGTGIVPEIFFIGSVQSRECPDE